MTSTAPEFDPAVHDSGRIGEQHRARLKTALRDGASPFPVLVDWQVALRVGAERALAAGYTAGSVQLDPFAEIEVALRQLAGEQLAAT